MNALTLKILIPCLLVAGLIWWAFPGLHQEVSAATVARGQAVDAVAGNVRILPQKEILVRASESGVVGEILHVQAGETRPVREGEVICRLDTRLMDFQIEQARLDLEIAEKRLAIGSPLEAEYALLKSELARFERLVEMEHSPESERTRRESELERTRRNLELQRADWDSAVARGKSRLSELEARRERMVIRAPIDGILVESYVHAGDLLHPGSAVARILSRGLTVEISVSEEDFSGLQPGMEASMRFLGMADRVYTGEITGLAPTSDAATKRRLVYARVQPDEADMLAVGMTGEAILTRNVRDQALIVPRRALLGDSVFVIENGSARLRSVVAGYTGLTQAEILQGLDDGELVVTDNLARLRDGDRVRIRP